jgi:hypothetical protein
MSNPSKAKGTSAESLLVAYLRRWWPNAERRSLNGTKDRGDVAGIPGTVIEVKACKEMDLAGWLRELDAEMANEQAHTGTEPYGVVIAKRRGTLDVGRWYAVMTVDEWVSLRAAAGVRS